jgi:chromosome segregation ATPase
MTDKIDTSPEAVERLAKVADMFAKAMKAWQHKTQKHNEDVRDTLRALSARVAELEAECWRMQEERNRAIGWRDSDQARAEAAEQRAAELEERYLAIAGDKINLRGQVAELEAKLAKADAWQDAVFAVHPNIDLDIETYEPDT